MSLKEDLGRRSPYLIQNIGISLFNTYQYKIRHGGKYNYFREYYSRIDNFNEKQLKNEFLSKKIGFLTYVTKNSSWYQGCNFEEINSFNILEKQDIIDHLDEIKTLDESKGLVSMTGGTTGTSLKVIYTKDDIQERYAVLDHFRSKHGYQLGKKTAWFSGKNLIVEKDIRKGVCSHYDYINKIRFYSTFHINQKNFELYWESLKKFKPEFIVGFPSSVYEICEIANRRGLSLINKVKVFFPTAETVLPEHRELINKVLGCNLVDQYASSEGAPFILECQSGSLHIHPLTGIFEVVDENMQPAREGELLVTSFTTKGTPLIRYRIGDRIKLGPSNKACRCGSLFPLVESIEGRANSFIYSPDKGKINLNHLSIFTREAKGLVCIQIIQESIHKVTLKMVTSDAFNYQEEKMFVSHLRKLIGSTLEIDIQYVENIPREKSGKFRMVINHIENLR